MDQAPKQWWGSFDCDVGTGLRWQLGPLHMVAMRGSDVWSVGFRNVGNPLDPTVEVAQPINEMPEDMRVRQYAIGSRGSTLHLNPLCADRPFVARPESTFVILPGSRITCFVGTALWVRLQVSDDPSGMDEIPICRPQDTWFGEDTVKGELCYASSTMLLRRIENMPVRGHRVVTPVVIENRGNDTLMVRRMRIPSPHLRLYRATNGRLWTEQVTLVRGGTQDDLTMIGIDRGAPADAREPEKVADPRSRLDHPLGKIMSALLGTKA